jgi:type IV secretion system protein VirB11
MLQGKGGVGKSLVAPMQPLIAEAVDVVCFIERTATGRRVSEVTRVLGFDPETLSYQLESLC